MPVSGPHVCGAACSLLCVVLCVCGRARTCLSGRGAHWPGLGRPQNSDSCAHCACTPEAWFILVCKLNAICKDSGSVEKCEGVTAGHVPSLRLASGPCEPHVSVPLGGVCHGPSPGPGARSSSLKTRWACQQVRLSQRLLRRGVAPSGRCRRSVF